MEQYANRRYGYRSCCSNLYRYCYPLTYSNKDSDFDQNGYFHKYKYNYHYPYAYPDTYTHVNPDEHTHSFANRHQNSHRNPTIENIRIRIASRWLVT